MCLERAKAEVADLRLEIEENYLHLDDADA